MKEYMQVFEFHFNPKLREDLIFESFCYEPENVYEKRLGSLYLVGELKNALPQNYRLLDNLASTIKKEYYLKFQRAAEQSLKESLKKANEFLTAEVSRDNVSWLGNLSLAALSLKDFNLNLTKVGSLKILLLRKGQITDLGKKLEFEEIEPYPLKIFSNIVSGKLAQGDLILVLTQEVFSIFQQENLLAEIAKTLLSGGINQKKLKEIFKDRRKELLKTTGICLLIFLTKETGLKKETLATKLPREKFYFREVFTPFVKALKILFKKLSFPFPQVKFPTFRIARGRVRDLILILTLILLLSLGYFIFQREKEQQLREYQLILSQIQEKFTQAESFLILKETTPQLSQKANSLLKTAREEISFLVKISPTLPPDFRQQVSLLKESIEKNLYQLNKLIVIETPELFFEFNPREFIPQKMIIFNNNLYLFSPYSQNLFKITQKVEEHSLFSTLRSARVNEGQLIQINQKFNSAAPLTNLILFFSKPDKLFPFQNDQFAEAISLENPYPDLSFDAFSSFKFTPLDSKHLTGSNLYFLDKKSGEIIKYPSLENLKWQSPQIWLSAQTKKASDSKSLAIDGSIWILTKNNTLERYYAGNFQETLKLDFFPYPKDFSKIFTLPNLPYFYLLEPAQNRLIILDKKGGIVQQFQSQKFDNLLDFGVSTDGKTIWLLNGLRVYQILFAD